MKKIVNITLAAVSAATLFSCQIENDAPVQESISLTCSFADTKVSIDGTGKTAWEVGDRIYVHGELGQDANKGQIVTLTADDIHNNGKTATLTFSEENVPAYVREDCVSTRYASYPAEALDPVWSSYYYGVYKNTNFPIMQGYDDGNGNMIFYNLCAAISFKVSGEYDSYKFSGNNDEAVGYTHVAARLALRSDGTSLKFNIPYDSELHSSEKNSEPLTALTGDVTADGSTENFIYIFNGADFTKGFTIKFFKAGKVVKEISTQTAINLERGQYKPLGNVTAYLKDSEDTSDDEPDPVAVKIDGNMSEWADCPYGVSGSGPYKVFKVSYDETYFYFYCKRDFRNTYWNGNGYFYIDFDLDSNSETGITKDSVAGLESYIFFYPFGGTNESPAINTAPNGTLYANDSSTSYKGAANSCAGVIGTDDVEIEIQIPRADIGAKAGDKVTIYSWGNKDAANIKSTPVVMILKK